MISKKQRLNRNELGLVLKKGTKVNNLFFSIKKKENRLPFKRYSVVISKKIISDATKRNLLRRKIYEIIRKNTKPLSTTTEVTEKIREQNIPPSSQQDIIIFPQVTVKNLKFKELQEKILPLINL